MIVVSPVPPFATLTGVDKAYCSVVALAVTESPVPAVGVINAGSAPVDPTSSCPLVPTAVAEIAEVP